MAMAEMRRLNRVNLRMVGTFLYNGTSVDCQLENLSMDGALISTEGSLGDLQVGDECILQIPQDIEYLNLTINARVVHQLYAFVGLCFCGVNLQTYSLLEYVIHSEKEKQGQLNVSDDCRLLPPGTVS